MEAGGRVGTEVLISSPLHPAGFSQSEKYQGVKLTPAVPAQLQLHWKDTRQTRSTRKPGATEVQAFK